jgi:hypothetical protein
LDEHAEQTIALVIDRMLPDDELPGALALGIHRRTSAMADVPPRQDVVELLSIFASGIGWLDRRARGMRAPDFLRLGKPQQDALLRSALGSKHEGAAGMVSTLRDRAFALYYTHPNIMAAFAYTGPPQPEGFPDFQGPPE